MESNKPDVPRDRFSNISNLLALALSIALVFILVVHDFPAFAQPADLPGVVPPSACRVGAVLSTDVIAPLFGVFAGLGRSNIRSAFPNDEVVAGTWTVCNNCLQDTSIKLAPNCAPPLGGAIDGAGLNLMGVRITTTISSPQKADIESVKLVWDVNVNGLWDPLLDLVLLEKPGSELLQEGGALFTYGPQQPLAFLSNSAGICRALGVGDVPTATGIGPANGINSRLPAGTDGCYIALLAIVKIGDMPVSRTKFGLQLEAFAGDIPGSTGISSYTVSSGFSHSRNPQASNATVDIFGGLPGVETPFDHLNYGIGNPQNSFEQISFRGGINGEGLLTRFREPTIGPGTREMVLFAGGLCDGGILAIDEVTILPPVAGAPPTIAGGLPAIPCIVSPNTDGIPTGVISVILRLGLPPELKELVGTIRLYGDLDCDGVLFEPGELIQQRVPFHNEPTDEVYAHFNPHQVGFILTPAGLALAGGCPFVGGVPGADASPLPLILILTGDLNGGTAHQQGFGPYLNEIELVRAQQNGDDEPQVILITPGGDSDTCPDIPGAASVASQGTSSFFPPWCLPMYRNGEMTYQNSPSDASMLEVVSQKLRRSIRFSVRGGNLRSANLEIFDLRGDSVYHSGMINPYQLIWNLRDRRGHPVANGVYLCVITGYNNRGDVVRSAVKRIHILR